jgi:aspartate racemase
MKLYCSQQCRRNRKGASAMKTIGLIGGTSWTSTIEYYRILNQETAKRLGGLHSARLLMVNLDFAELEAAMHSGRWDEAGEILAGAAKRLAAGGADGFMLCSNLVHRMADKVQSAVPVPFLHICDAIGAEIEARAMDCVALLGARETMEEEFYRVRIAQRSGARVLIPEPAERDYINETIFTRLCADIYTAEDRARFVAIIERLKAQGAKGVILGCTELPMLLPEAPLPRLDSVALHCAHALSWALN